MNTEKIKELRSIQACSKHLRISSNLKDHGFNSKYADGALYWSDECDDCAGQIVARWEFIKTPSPAGASSAS